MVDSVPSEATGSYTLTKMAKGASAASFTIRSMSRCERRSSWILANKDTATAVQQTPGPATPTGRTQRHDGTYAHLRRARQTVSVSATIRTIRAEEWPLWRDVRLRALTDSPDAFRPTLEVIRLMALGSPSGTRNAENPEGAFFDSGF